MTYDPLHEPADPQAPPVDPALDSPDSAFYESLRQKDQQRAAVRSNVKIGAGFNPDQYAKSMQLASRTKDVPAQVYKDPEAFATAMKMRDAEGFTSTSPGLAEWLAKDPSNAAIAHDDLGSLERFSGSFTADQRAAFDANVGSAQADTTSAFERNYALPVLRKLQSAPPTRFAVGAVGGTLGLLGDVGGFLGIHGDNNAPNLLQRGARYLDPSVSGADTTMLSRHLTFDTIAENVGPLIPTLGFGVGATATGRALGLSERAIKYGTALGIGGLFTAQQGGATYQQLVQAGKTPEEARDLANKVAAINAPANVLLSALGAHPLAQEYGAPFAAFMGAAQGASGQLGQNFITGQPLDTALPEAALKGGAMMLGLHTAFSAMDAENARVKIESLADLAKDSKLLKRFPEKGAEAVQALTDAKGQGSVMVDVQRFNQALQKLNPDVDPAVVADAMGITNYEEANAIGSNLVIPTGKYVETIAANMKLHDALADDLQVPLADGTHSLSPRSIRENSAAFEKQVKDIADSLGTGAEYDPKKSGTPEQDYNLVKEEAKQRIVDGLHYTPDVADTYARDLAAVFAQMADNTGLTIHEVAAHYMPSISGHLDVRPEPLPHPEDVRATAEQVFTDPAAEAAYAKLKGTRGGAHLDVDHARMLDPNYNDNPAHVAPLHHEAVSGFIKKMFADRMAMPLEKQNEVVRFMAGGGGSGKGTAIEAMPKVASHTSVDGTFANFDSAKKMVDLALENKRRVMIDFVYRPIGKAVEGMVGRAHETGRVVPLDVMASSHKNAPETILKLMDAYKDDPRVHVRVIDNSGAKEDIRVVPQAETKQFLESHVYGEDVAQRAQQAYNQLKEHGYEQEGKRLPVADRIHAAVTAGGDSLDSGGVGSGRPDGSGLAAQGPAGEGQVTLRQGLPQEWEGNRGQIRSARALVLGIDKPTYDKFKAAMREQLGPDYNRVVRGIEFGGAKGDAALKQVYEKAKLKEIPGAPSTVRTPADHAELLNKLEDLARTGEAGRFWYDDSAKSFLRMAGGDRLKAFKLAVLSALYSPQTGVPDNGRRAILAYYDAMQNKAVSAGGVYPKVKELAAKVTNASSMEDLNAILRGQRVDSFQQNLINLFAPEHAKDDVATIDLHMMRALGYDTESPTSVQYKWAEQTMRDVAASLGWGSAKEAQAAIWTAQKMKTDRGGKGTSVDVAATHYGGAAEKIAGQVHAESMPGADQLRTIFPGIDKATRPQLEQYHAEKMGIVLDALHEAGVLTASERTGHGQYGDESNPVTAFRIPLPHIGSADEHVLSDSAIHEVTRAAKLVGAVLGDQDSIGWVRYFDKTTQADANATHYALNRELTAPEAKTLAEAFNKLGLDAFIDASDTKNLKVVNYNWEGVKDPKTYRKQLDSAILAALPEDIQADAHLVHAQSGLVERSTNGNDQAARPSAEGAPASEAAYVARGRQQVEALNERYRTEFGWGTPDGPGAGDRSAVSGRPDGSVEAGITRGVHYGNTPDLTELRGDAYGQGSAGRERARVEAAAKSDDPTLSALGKRSFFYEAKPGEGLPAKESIVTGSHPYTADLAGVLHDPAKIAELRDRAIVWADKQTGPGSDYHNAFEREVLLAGYKGYAAEVHGIPGRAIVMLGHDSIPVQSATVLHQGPGAEPNYRGQITWDKDGNIQIGLGKKHDATSLVHEFSHGYLKMLSELAQRADASPRLKEMYATVLKHLGAPEGASLDQLTTAQHEQFAQWGEQYAMRGKAPSEALRPVFERFKVWMMGAYKNLTALGKKIPKEIVDVFDRMRASDDAIEAAKHDVPTTPLFATPEDMGKTPEEFQLYVEKSRRTLQEAKDELQRKQAAILKAAQTEARQQEAQGIREEATKELSARPEYRALKALTDGQLEDGTPIKLDKQSLVGTYGEEAVKSLPRKFQRIYTTKAGEGIPADAAAEILGFDSGDALVQALRDAAPLKQAVESRVQAEMMARHGDMQFDGTLQEEAHRALHNELREDVLREELKVLKRKASEMKPMADLKDKQAKAEDRAAQAARRRAAEEIPPIEAFRAAAKQIIAAKALKDINPNEYRLAGQKASRQAFDLNGKGAFDEAAVAKQAEILNQHMFTEATKVKAELEKGAKNYRGMALQSLRQKVGLAGPSYREQFDNLIARYGFEPMTNKALAAKAQEAPAMSLSEWEAKLRGEGEPVAIGPDVIANQGAQRNYREVPTTEVRAVMDALKNIQKLAHDQIEMDINGVKLKFNKEAAEFNETARRNLPSVPTPRRGTKLGVIEEGSKTLRSFEAYMDKMEWFIDKLDNGDINGPARRNIKKVIDDAAGREKQLQHEVKQQLLPVFKDMTNEERYHEYDSIGVKFPKMDRPLTRMQLKSWAMNLGTEEGRRPAIIGEGLVNEDGTMRPEFQAALSKLTTKEARQIQGVWDALESLRPKITEHELKTTGVEPKWKTLTPFKITTADGEEFSFRGGYYPQVADHTVSNIGLKQLDPTARAGAYAKPTTYRGYTKEVTGATYPVLMDYNYVLGQHLPAVIKDITSSEAIRYVSRFLSNQSVTDTIRETLGQERAAEFKTWLDRAADQGMDSSKNGPFMRWLMERKSAMVAARIFGNFSSYAVHAGTDWLKPVVDADSFQESGKNFVDLLSAFTDIRKNPKAMIDEIRRLSPNEMRYREDHFQRDLADMFQSKSFIDTHGKTVSEFMAQVFSVLDRLLSTATWLSKYRQGMKAHGDEARAVMEADRSVARNLQTGENRNMSRMMSDPGAMRIFTAFGGPASTWYGIVHNALSGSNPQRAGLAIMALIAEGVVANLIRGNIPQKDESDLGWFGNNIFEAFMYPLGFMGSLGDAALKKVEGKYAAVNNPILDSLEKFFVKVPGDIHDVAVGKKDKEQLAMSTVDAIGMYQGIPGTGQLVKSWKYNHDVRTGKARPNGPLDYARGLATGKDVAK